MRWNYFIPLILGLLILSSCAQPPTEEIEPPTEEVEPPTEEIERIVKVEAAEQVLYYQRQSFWTEDKFLALSTNKAGFRAEFMANFNQSLTRYGLSAQNYEISFDEPTGSTKVTCHIYKGVSKSGDNYTARFEWLSLPSGFDLMNFSQTSPDTLQGITKVKGVPTTFSLCFPVPIEGNCHYHVWYRITL